MTTMWKLLTSFRNLSCHGKGTLNATFQGRRFFLSEAYQCRTAWENRLQSPVLRNLRFDELHQEMDQKFQKEGIINVLDIDLFANAVKEEIYSDELEDVIHKLRLCRNTSFMLPSTPHAFIRYYLDIGKYEELLRVLDDRLNYGLFPDDYSFCLLLDTFIKKEKFTEAGRVCVLNMLQEDWSNQLGLHLALYACHMYLLDPKPWSVESTEENDTGEEIKVRVKYIRNPYFDDHFDLRDPTLLMGKTMMSVGKEIPDAVGHTFHLVGLSLYKKWEKALVLLEELKSSNLKPNLYKSGVEIFESHLHEEFKEEKSKSEIKDKIEEHLKYLKSQGFVSTDDLHSAVIKKVKEVVLLEEANVIKEQEKIYAEWVLNREKLLEESIKEMKRQERLALIQKEKELLAEKEEHIFFFDNEEKIDLLIEKAMEQKPTEEKKKMKETTDDSTNYIPPEV